MIGESSDRFILKCQRCLDLLSNNKTNMTKIVFVMLSVTPILIDKIEGWVSIFRDNRKALITIGQFF